MTGTTPKPMLATLADTPLVDPGLVYEPKYDGIRAIVEVAPSRTGADVRIWSRNGNDKTRQFPGIVGALKEAGPRAKARVVLDGEIVALDEAGRPAGFQRLQGRMHLTGEADIRRQEHSQPAALIVFDLLREGDEDLCPLPLTSRRERLEAFVQRAFPRNDGTLRMSEQVRGDARALEGRARAEGWEGLIAKEARSTYQAGRRSPAWRKIKLVHEQEFVVGGWTEPRQTRSYFGALLLGVYNGADLVYVGHTGTGFDQKELARVWKLLQARAIGTSPFSTRFKTNEPAHWVRPDLVAQIKFTEWTADDKLRHPVYLGLRDDKAAHDVVRETTATDAAPHKGAPYKRGRSAGSAVGPLFTAASASAGAPVTAGRASVDAAPHKGAPYKRGRSAGSAVGPPGTAASASAGAPVTAGRASVDPAPHKGAPYKRSRSAGSAAGPPITAASGSAGAPVAAGRGSVGRPFTGRRSTTGKRQPAPTTDLDPILAQLRALEDARRDGTIELPGGDRVGVTNLSKPFWPALKITKGDLLRYYVEVSPYLLPAVADRPLVMKRFPNGVAGKAFYQQRSRAEKPPAGVRVERLPEGFDPIGEEDASRFVGGSLTTLLYMTQLAAISQDPWFSRVDSPRDADYVAIDLDPTDEATFARVLDVARWVRDELASMKVPCVPKTSGSSGLHIYVPLPPHTSYESGMLFCQIVATIVASRHPKAATVERAVARRLRGTVYVDFLQNILGKTLATAYSARASDYAGVSTPLTWKEVDEGVDPRDFTIRTAPQRFHDVGDLWAPLREGKPANLEGVFRKYAR